MNAFAVVSDSGTLPEESSFFTSVGHSFPAVCIRTSTERPENPLICCEGQTDAFEINGFERSETAEVMPNNPVLFVRNVRNLSVAINEEEKAQLKEKSDCFISEGKIVSIKINKL
jgi:hypothetical protein